MKKKTLQDVLEAHKGDDFHFTGGRNYHEAEDIMDIVREVVEYADDEITDAEELRDEINEQADSATPIYNKDRAEWFGENWQAYDEIADELGREGMGNDIMQGIGVAYCLTLEREAYEALEELFKEAEEKEEADEEGTK